MTGIISLSQWSPLHSPEYRRAQTSCDRFTGAQNTTVVSRVLSGLPVQTDIRHSWISSVGTYMMGGGVIHKYVLYVFLLERVSWGFIWCVVGYSYRVHAVSMWGFAVFSSFSSCWPAVHGGTFQSQNTTTQKQSEQAATNCMSISIRFNSTAHS